MDRHGPSVLFVAGGISSLSGKQFLLDHLETTFPKTFVHVPCLAFDDATLVTNDDGLCITKRQNFTDKLCWQDPFGNDSIALHRRDILEPGDAVPCHTFSINLTQVAAAVAQDKIALIPIEQPYGILHLSNLLGQHEVISAYVEAPKPVIRKRLHAIRTHRAGKDLRAPSAHLYTLAEVLEQRRCIRARIEHIRNRVGPILQVDGASIERHYIETLQDIAAHFPSHLAARVA